jgi:hypothetical protein
MPSPAKPALVDLTPLAPTSRLARQPVIIERLLPIAGCHSRPVTQTAKRLGELHECLKPVILFDVSDCWHANMPRKCKSHAEILLCLRTGSNWLIEDVDKKEK